VSSAAMEDARDWVPVMQIPGSTVEYWIPCTLRTGLMSHGKAVFEHEARSTCRQAEWMFQ
jgi:hypothetical protein